MEDESELNQKVEMIETAIDEEEEEDKEEEAGDASAHPEGKSSLNAERRIYFVFFQYFFHCFICRPSDSTRRRMPASNPGQLRLLHWLSEALHRKKKVREFPVPSRDVMSLPNSPWAGIMTS
jgi:hypothetical protein